MRCVGGVLVVALIVQAGARAAEPVKRIYVFGDSYSDIGRGWLDSDGPTAVVYLAKRLGLKMVASNAPDAAGKSLDFAVSGAPTGSSPGRAVPNGWHGLGMKEEVDEFAGMVKSGAVKFDPKTTLFFIAGGLNDVRIPTEETVANLEGEIEALYAIGARRFEVAILPEKIPGFDRTAMRLNPALTEIPAAMRGNLAGAQIETSHWGAFYDAVMMNAAKYGLTDTTNPCAAGRPPCASPETHFYYYPGHPSTAVSKVVGDMLFDEVKGR
jgi:phospholipase/lecithinase/hemolysin